MEDRSGLDVSVGSTGTAVLVPALFSLVNVLRPVVDADVCQGMVKAVEI